MRGLDHVDPPLLPDLPSRDAGVMSSSRLVAGGEWFEGQTVTYPLVSFEITSTVAFTSRTSL